MRSQFWKSLPNDIKITIMKHYYAMIIQKKWKEFSMLNSRRYEHWQYLKQILKVNGWRGRFLNTKVWDYAMEDYTEMTYVVKRSQIY